MLQLLLYVKIAETAEAVSPFCLSVRPDVRQALHAPWANADLQGKTVDFLFCWFFHHMNPFLVEADAGSLSELNPL